MRTQALSARWESVNYLSFYTPPDPLVIFVLDPSASSLVIYPRLRLPAIDEPAFVNLAPGWAAPKNLSWPGAIDGRQGINRPALMLGRPPIMSGNLT